MNRFLILGVFFALLNVVACTKEDEEVLPEPTYEIPTTYDFENVDYTGQTQRLAMLLELKSYMSTANTVGTALDKDQLLAMFANDAANANWSGSYDASKQLKDKTFEPAQADFEALLDALATASTSQTAGSEGQAGVVESLNGAKKYLLSDKGIDLAQVIEKGLMGACFYYQATAVYFGEDRMNVDNEVVEPGTGTKMEHHWDEAFGYFGVPKEFPTITDGLFFWGVYSNNYNNLTGSNQKMMDGFLKGRAAISNDDLETRDEAIAEVRTEWERISAAAALHYFNVGINQFDDVSIRTHALSEAIGFVYSLQFNPEKSVSNDQVNELLSTFAGSTDFDAMNLYTTSIANIQKAKDDLAAYFGMEDIKDQL